MERKVLLLLIGITLLVSCVHSKEYLCSLAEDRTCNLVGVQIKSASDGTAATFAAGNPANVKSVDFLRSSMTTVPKSLFAGFPKLELVNASRVGIKNLDEDMFADAKTLRELYLGGNKISTVRNNAFRGLRQLKVLDLSQNAIGTIEENAFQRMRELTTLFLGGNQLQRLPERTLNDQSELQQLELQQNQLTNVDDQLLADCTSLSKLNVSYNALKRLNLRIFERRWTFDIVDVSSNRLTAVELPSNLRQLVAARNEIRTITLTGNSSALILLKVPHNKIASTDVLPALENLISLDLSYNQLSTFDFVTVTKYPKLILLKLDGNQLSTVSNGLTVPFTGLKYVHLAHNQFARFDLDVLRTVPRIIKLDLRGNQLTELAGANVGSKFPVLVRLMLEGNDLRCDANRKVMKELRLASVSHGMLEGDCRKHQKLIDNVCCA